MSGPLSAVDLDIRTCRKEGYPLGELDVESPNDEESKDVKKDRQPIRPYGEYDPNLAKQSTLIHFWDWAETDREQLYATLKGLKQKHEKTDGAVAANHIVKMITICRGKDKAAWQAFAKSQDKSGIESYWLPPGSEILNDFEAPGLPFAALADKSGLLVWTGHPNDRDLSYDFEELGKNHLIFETADWHEDPDRPVKDPEEIDLHRERD